MATGKGGISTAKGRGKPIDLRMSQLDKYLSDPNLELVRTAGGKFQFREKKAKDSSSSLVRKPKTSMANKVPGAASKTRTSGGSIPTPARNPRPLSEFTGRKPRALDIATKVTPPKQPGRKDYSSPRAKRNMAFAETALSAITPFGLGRASKAAKAVSEIPKYSKYTKAIEANRKGQVTAREAMEQMGMPFTGKGNPRAAANAQRAKEALRGRNVTVEEAADMALGYRKGGLAKKRSRRK